MVIINQKITIVKIRKTPPTNINEELQFLGTSLGLFGLRDKDKSCYRLFLELLKHAKLHRPLSSDDLALRLSLSRGTVVHHINKLMEAGIVIAEKNRYFLRVDRLEQLVKEIRKDILRTIDDLEDMAKKIDEGLGL